jgi:hypothetical protein
LSVCSVYSTLNRQFWTVDKGWYSLLVLGGGAINSSLEAKNFAVFQNLVMVTVMNESADAVYWSCDSVTDSLFVGSSKCQKML